MNGHDLTASFLYNGKQVVKMDMHFKEKTIPNIFTGNYDGTKIYKNGVEIPLSITLSGDIKGIYPFGTSGYIFVVAASNNIIYLDEHGDGQLVELFTVPSDYQIISQLNGDSYTPFIAYEDKICDYQGNVLVTVAEGNIRIFELNANPLSSDGRFL